MRVLKVAFFFFIVLALSFEGVPDRSVNALQGSMWILDWSDEFNSGRRPDPEIWNYHVGNGWNMGANGFLGWGNNELEWYRPGNCYVQDGSLVIEASYSDMPTRIDDQDWHYHSCRITTHAKRSIAYGAVEASIRMPNASGTWSAFWMMGDACDDTFTRTYKPPITHYDIMNTNWSSCGEIDIMEHRNSETLVTHNLFWDTRTGLFPWAPDKNANNPTSYVVGNVDEFHVYRLEWTPTQLQWLVDDALVKTQAITADNMEEFHRPFHIILNLALGGHFTGGRLPDPADFPLFMYVDYVRVYGLQSQPDSTN